MSSTFTKEEEMCILLPLKTVIKQKYILKTENNIKPSLLNQRD